MPRNCIGRALAQLSLESGEAKNDKGYETTSLCTNVDSRVNTHSLGFQKWELYHGTAVRVILSTLARITPREYNSTFNWPF